MSTTTTESTPATGRKAQEGHPYKELYSKSRRNALPPGTDAPDFTLRSTPDQWLTLSEFRGQPVVLAFYPADWSPVCGDQMALYNEILKEFHEMGAELIGISVDGAWCHAAFARDRKLHFPLLADFEPKGEVARRYGVYRDKDGVSERALFVIDADRKVYWSFVSPIAVNPGADGILSALEELQQKQSTMVAAK
jgi:peroxiredoxin